MTISPCFVLVSKTVELRENADGTWTARYTIKTVPRRARERHKEQVVRRRQFDTLKLVGEEVAEFAYRPVACKRTYRVVVLRKKLVVEKGQMWLFEPDRFFF